MQGIYCQTSDVNMCGKRKHFVIILYVLRASLRRNQLPRNTSFVEWIFRKQKMNQPGNLGWSWNEKTHRWWIWSLLWIHVKSSHPGHQTWLEKPRTSHGALVWENHRTSSSYFSWNQIKLDHNLKIRSWNQYSKQIISSASMVILCYGACHFGRAQAGPELMSGVHHPRFTGRRTQRDLMVRGWILPYSHSLFFRDNSHIFTRDHAL